MGTNVDKGQLKTPKLMRRRKRKIKASLADDETVWEVVQRLGKTQTPFERPVAVEPAQTASNVDLSIFGADVQCLLGTRHHVVDNGFNNRGHYANAYKRTKPLKWSARDTERFYEAVENFGLDLLMVRSMLQEFTDRQIYDKFKLEERRNPDKLQLAIKAKTKIPISKFEQDHGKIDESQHYDPEKDPVLIQKNQKINQLALKTQMDLTPTPAPLEAPEPLKVVEPDTEPESGVQGSNIMELFM